MEEKLIIRLSNNIGNQMFMFAAGYATSKLLKENFILIIYPLIILEKIFILTL